MCAAVSSHGGNDSDGDETVVDVVVSVDVLPRDTLDHIVGFLLRTDLASVAVATRSFKEVLYSPRMMLYRAAISLVGLAPTDDFAVLEAKKWYEISAELYRSREAFTVLGIIAKETSLFEAERLLRAALAAESTATSYVLLDPPGHALDVAQVELARVLMKQVAIGDRGPDNFLVSTEQRNAWLDEAEALVRGVLAHDVTPPRQPVGLLRPHRAASVVLARIIVRRGEGSLSESLAVLDARLAALVSSFALVAQLTAAHRVVTGLETLDPAGGWNIDIVYAVVKRMKDKFDVGTAFPPVLERLLDDFCVCPPAHRPICRRAIEDFLEAEHTGVKATMIDNYRKTIARALVPPMLEINVEEYGLKMRLHAERAARATLPDERDPFRWYPWKTGTSPYTSFH